MNICFLSCLGQRPQRELIDAHRCDFPFDNAKVQFSTPLFKYYLPTSISTPFYILRKPWLQHPSAALRLYIIYMRGGVQPLPAYTLCVSAKGYGPLPFVG
ncbi:MAG: hypothetical protein SO096_01260, partial [Prevotella sp.]|nr:hypothetical protein [Prevotella sp.]